MNAPADETLWLEAALAAKIARAGHSGENQEMSSGNINISNLSAEERLALLEEIWDSLQPEDVPLTEAQRQELDRRLDDLDREPGRGIPWEEVLRRIRNRGA